YEAGRIIKKGDEFFVQKMGDVIRLPIYDNLSLVQSINKNDYNDLHPLRLPGLDRAIKYNIEIAKVAEKNQYFLRKNKDLDDILKGNKEIFFTLHKQEVKNRQGRRREINPNAIYACLTEKSKESIMGFIKFTGPDKISVNKNPKTKFYFNPDWENKRALQTFITHNEVELRYSIKKKYPRPVLACVREDVEYRMEKRCERIFSVYSDNPVMYPIPEEIVQQYNNIIEDNKKNSEATPMIFRTIHFNETLSEGDLVYYRINNNIVKEVIPVLISRLSDNKTMSERFPNNNKSLISCSQNYNKNCEGFYSKGLCPACHLFGAKYYKSRIGFSMAWLEGEAPIWYLKNKEDKKGGGLLTLPSLEHPHLTWSMPYEESVIPGRKFYIHHPWSVDKMRENQFKHENEIESQPDTIKKTLNNITVEPLGKENHSFHGF
ncbi:hypothetical protein MHK_006615, partial [Candidatus Magnetomorum sp. HK-1]